MREAVESARRSPELFGWPSKPLDRGRERQQGEAFNSDMLNRIRVVAIDAAEGFCRYRFAFDSGRW
jgi:hypothetical protein